MLCCCVGKWEPFFICACFKSFQLVDYGMSEIKGLTQSMLQSFQKQLTETKARNEQLLLENINLKKDLEIR